MTDIERKESRMELKVVIRGVDDDTELRAFAEEKLGAMLDRFDHAVHSATMRLEDETGPAKHGVDKVCHIEVKLRRGEVRIREVGEEFYATVDVALDRLKAALSREVAKNKHGVGEG